MKAHVVKDGKIVNTIIVDSLDFMEGLINAELKKNIGGIGDSYNGSKVIRAKEKAEKKKPKEVRLIEKLVEKGVISQSEADKL